ncbi:Holliday junction resolvase RusA (prophage-encoded endonuclease) (RusA) [Fructobacillus fructosus]|uniref:Holliday junction resolvase RusA (Prophage-encoded endonuclease) (RusA) n=1 Tax=Fructobacillus fructosus TaxID=1631 RepID=A0ABM9MVH7_9LACO|nr:Holliday junction resolvase RusA (prophage-encoded endonuclease) (RusA) [Fructobacillus fructosus]
MAETIKIEFDIKPQQQERPRIGMKSEYNRSKTYTKRKPYLYDPKKVVEYKKRLAYLANLEKSVNYFEPLSGALALNVTFYILPPKSLSKVKHAMAIIGDLLPFKKPDLSNYIKSTEDALNGILWKDDAMLCDINAKKRFSDEEKIVIEVSKINDKQY